MTARRHRHYRRALDLLAALEDCWLPGAGREILEDLAEQMLLSRHSDPVAIRELRREVEVSVGELAVVGVLPHGIAGELTQLLMGAGPPLVMEPSTAESRRAA
jgi:hypothetical protein